MRPEPPATEREIEKGHFFRGDWHYSVCQVCRCSFPWLYGDPLGYNQNFENPNGVCLNCIGKAKLKPRKEKSAKVDEQLCRLGKTISELRAATGLGGVALTGELRRLKDQGLAESRNGLWFAKGGA